MSNPSGPYTYRSERSPLLRPTDSDDHLQHDVEAEEQRRNRRGILAGVLTFVFVLGLALVWSFFSDRLSDDPLLAARQILDRVPVIDGHIDLPIVARFKYANNVSDFDLRKLMPLQVDIPRLRSGRVGGFFWSVYVDCKYEGPQFTKPAYRVRDTLEQIDVAKLMIKQYPDTFKLALTVDDVRAAIRENKIASLIGVEGAHQLSNSLGVLRQYQELGVRYVTLTHSCHNAFADSGGIIEPLEPLHGGLSPLGRALIGELNRLGVLVDLSHVSDATAIQALKLAKSPVIWSHSSARTVYNVSRNVPDEILQMIGTSKDKVDGVVMVNFGAIFIAPPGQANVELVANHIEHIAKVAGKEHVGIGSDFDGIGDYVPIGLEDVSKYPDLFAVLYKRGWTRQELGGVASGNLLRVMHGAETASWRLRHEGAKPAMDLYSKRPDLPVHGDE